MKIITYWTLSDITFQSPFANDCSWSIQFAPINFLISYSESVNIRSVEKGNKLFDNAKEHVIEKRGMTAALDDATKNEEKYGSSIKKI